MKAGKPGIAILGTRHAMCYNSPQPAVSLLLLPPPPHIATTFPTGMLEL